MSTAALHTFNCFDRQLIPVFKCGGIFLFVCVLKTDRQFITDFFCRFILFRQKVMTSVSMRDSITPYIIYYSLSLPMFILLSVYYHTLFTIQKHWLFWEINYTPEWVNIYSTDSVIYWFIQNCVACSTETKVELAKNGQSISKYCVQNMNYSI